MVPSMDKATDTPLAHPMSYSETRILEIRGEPPPKPFYMNLIPTEHQEQVTVIDWWNITCKRFGLPASALFAIPNAGAGAQRGQAGKMKAEGVRRGIPDLFLAVPRTAASPNLLTRYHGMFIEMKRRGKRATDEQEQEMNALMRRGYWCVTCDSADGAMRAITAYLQP